MNFLKWRTVKPLPIIDRIQELVNAISACKEKVTDQTLPPEFDYVAAAIKESKDLDTMEVEELQHSLEVHEMRVNKGKEDRPSTEARLQLQKQQGVKV
ncbi:hypothetical protein CR513_02873, partial [Mucuna pruriens]